jgi:GNAT superfamily N-acetyltransferase
MTELTRVQTQEQVSNVVNLAREIWTDHYVPIIGQEQVAYMLDKFQSQEAITAQLAVGYEYYIVTHDGRRMGYLAVVPNDDEDALMISKIYVTKPGRGLGLGRKMLSFAEDACRERRIKTLWLTVNRHNTDTIAWYTRMGFKNAGPIVQDIGGGFVMDDFRMEKTVNRQSLAGDSLKSEPGR